MRQLLYLLSLIGLTAIPVWAQDSSATTPRRTPADAKDVVISPGGGSDSTDAAYEAEARERRDTVTYAAANDRTPVRVRSLDEDKLDDIRSDRAYQYRDSVPPTASLWDQFWAWFWGKVNDLLRTRGYRSVGRYVLIAAAAVLIVWLLYKANVIKGLFGGRAKSLGLDYAIIDEDIHAINFAERIEAAATQGNYRLAVRLLYLQTLKRLTDNGLIRWQPNKTNRQYAYELTGNPARLGFEQLTTQFEYVWYGDFPVDETRFNTIRQAFTRFNAS